MPSCMVAGKYNLVNPSDIFCTLESCLTPSVRTSRCTVSSTLLSASASEADISAGNYNLRVGTCTRSSCEYSSVRTRALHGEQTFKRHRPESRHVLVVLFRDARLRHKSAWRGIITISASSPYWLCLGPPSDGITFPNLRPCGVM